MQLGTEVLGCGRRATTVMVVMLLATTVCGPENEHADARERRSCEEEDVGNYHDWQVSG